MLGQTHNRSMPFFDHLLQVRRVAVTQLFDRIDADAFKHLLAVRPDSLELVEVVRYVFRHLATPVLYVGQQRTDGLWKLPTIRLECRDCSHKAGSCALLPGALVSVAQS